MSDREYSRTIFDIITNCLCGREPCYIRVGIGTSWTIACEYPHCPYSVKIGVFRFKLDAAAAWREAIIAARSVPLLGVPDATRETDPDPGPYHPTKRRRAPVVPPARLK